MIGMLSCCIEGAPDVDPNQSMHAGLDIFVTPETRSRPHPESHEDNSHACHPLENANACWRRIEFHAAICNVRDKVSPLFVQVFLPREGPTPRLTRDSLEKLQSEHNFCDRSTSSLLLCYVSTYEETFVASLLALH